VFSVLELEYYDYTSVKNALFCIVVSDASQNQSVLELNERISSKGCSVKAMSITRAACTRNADEAIEMLDPRHGQYTHVGLVNFKCVSSPEVGWKVLVDVIRRNRRVVSLYFVDCWTLDYSHSEDLEELFSEVLPTHPTLREVIWSTTQGGRTDLLETYLASMNYVTTTSHIHIRGFIPVERLCSMLERRIPSLRMIGLTNIVKTETRADILVATRRLKAVFCAVATHSYIEALHVKQSISLRPDTFEPLSHMACSLIQVHFEDIIWTDESFTALVEALKTNITLEALVFTPSERNRVFTLSRILQLEYLVWYFNTTLRLIVDTTGQNTVALTAVTQVLERNAAKRQDNRLIQTFPGSYGI
jgi:hypothetical protein